MSFIIDGGQENGLSFVRLQDTGSQTTISMIPAAGALLHAFEIPLNGVPYNIIDHYRDREGLDAELGVSFKSAKLSPFACRVRDGKYHFGRQDYQLASNFPGGMAIHGLLYNKPFSVVDEVRDDHRAAVRLRYHYKGEEPGYPFEYLCEVQYMLHPNRLLQVETTILNLDSRTIPVTDGWHPYFRLGGSIDECTLQFSSGTQLEFDEHLVPTGRLLQVPDFLEPALLKGRELDNCFLLQVQDGRPCCVLQHPGNRLSLSFFTNALYPFLQIYTPSHRNSIAIENLSGAPDSFNNGMGLLQLAPQQSVAFNVWYQLSIG